LRADDFDPWFDEENLRPGQDWQFEIQQVMGLSLNVLVCLSASSVRRTGYFQREISLAVELADRWPEGSTYLIPVRLEPCSVPYRLRRWQPVDLFVPKGYEDLLFTLRSSPAPLNAAYAPPLRPQASSE
jgi:hypothetical protein